MTGDHSCQGRLRQVLQRWLPKVPAVLVAVVLSIAAAAVFDLAACRVKPVGSREAFRRSRSRMCRWSIRGYSTGERSGSRRWR